MRRAGDSILGDDAEVPRSAQRLDAFAAPGARPEFAAQVADVSRYADAVVVGSAIVAEMERCVEKTEVAPQISQFIKRITGFS